MDRAVSPPPTYQAATASSEEEEPVGQPARRTSTIPAPAVTNYTQPPPPYTTSIPAPGNASAVSAPTSTVPTPAAILATKILHLIVTNGLALTHRRQRPYTLTHLLTLRTQLLTDPFFDENHDEVEVGLRRRRNGRILFVELVVLVARLARVLTRVAARERMRQRGVVLAVEIEEVVVERVQVRNACLEEPFFQRGFVVAGGGRPFGGEAESGDDEDEGIVV